MQEFRRSGDKELVRYAGVQEIRRQGVGSGMQEFRRSGDKEQGDGKGHRCLPPEVVIS
jgi:hypothetical protein